jgi:hypothetical protein
VVVVVAVMAVLLVLMLLLLMTMKMMLMTIILKRYDYDEDENENDTQAYNSEQTQQWKEPIGASGAKKKSSPYSETHPHEVLIFGGPCRCLLDRHGSAECQLLQGDTAGNSASNEVRAASIAFSKNSG